MSCYPVPEIRSIQKKITKKLFFLAFKHVIKIFRVKEAQTQSLVIKEIIWQILRHYLAS